MARRFFLHTHLPHALCVPAWRALPIGLLRPGALLVHRRGHEGVSAPVGCADLARVVHILKGEEGARGLAHVDQRGLQRERKRKREVESLCVRGVPKCVCVCVRDEEEEERFYSPFGGNGAYWTIFLNILCAVCM